MSTLTTLIQIAAIGCSIAEYYHMTGSTKHLKKLENLKVEKSIKEIETNILSPKTSQCATYLVYIECILTHADASLVFYDYKTAKDRFYLYQGRQRAAGEMVNMLVHGGTKYNKKKRKRRNRKKQKLTANPKEKKTQLLKTSMQSILALTIKSYLIVVLKKPKVEARKVPNRKRESSPLLFGAGMFGKESIKLKGNWCGVTGVFWRALKRREAAGDLIAVTIDEYKTSKVCNTCSNDPLVRMSGLKGCSVLVCNTCKTLWQ